MNKFGKVLLCLSIPVLMAGTGCGIYYGIQYHNLDKQVVEDDSGMVNVVDELRKSVASLEKEKETLTKQLTALQGQYDALNQLRQNLENTNNALETENAELQLQFAELNNQNAQLETQIESLNNQITSLNTQIETLNKTLADNKSASDEEIVGLEVQVTTLQAQVNSLNTNIVNLNAEIDEYEVNTIALNTQIANLNNTIAEYEQEIENYKQIIEDLKKINSCVVTFIVDGELYNTQQVDKTESPMAIEVPTSESWKFEGWAISGTTVVVDPFTYSVTEDMEFVAIINKYLSVTFSVNDEVISTQSILTNDELQIPDAPEREHYNFLGWSLDGENIIDLSNYIISQDSDFVAIYEVIGQLPYTFNANTLTSYTGTDIAVTIPTSYSILEEGVYIEGSDYQVTAIGNNAFKGNAALSVVNLNDNITSIGTYAFSGCTNLINISLPLNLSSISNYCFSGCSSLNAITIHENITSIGSGAFQNCNNLTTITIPENITSIGTYAFSGCKNVTTINYNAVSVTDFSNKNKVFYKLGWDTEGVIVNIGNNVKKLPRYLFAVDTSSQYAPDNTIIANVKTINFLENNVLSEIGYFAFFNLRNLTEVNYNVKNLSSIDFNGIFQYAGTNTDGVVLNIGTNVEIIPANFFCPSTGNNMMHNLIEVNFAKNSICSVIGKDAFWYCDKLSSINYLPNTLQTIEEGAFDSCTALKTINFVGTEAEWNSISVNSTDNFYFINATVNYNYKDE